MVRTMTLLFRRWLSHFQEHFVTFAMFWSNLRQTLVSACSVFLLKLSLKQAPKYMGCYFTTCQRHFAIPFCHVWLHFPSTTFLPIERKSSEHCSSLRGQFNNHGNRTRAACMEGENFIRHAIAVQAPILFVNIGLRGSGRLSAPKVVSSNLTTTYRTDINQKFVAIQLWFTQ